MLANASERASDPRRSSGESAAPGGAHHPRAIGRRVVLQLLNARIYSEFKVNRELEVFSKGKVPAPLAKQSRQALMSWRLNSFYMGQGTRRRRRQRRFYMRAHISAADAI